MNILVSSDDRYAEALTVMLTSFLTTNPVTETDRHRIYLLESSLSNDKRKMITDRVVSLGGELCDIEISDGMFSGLETASYVSKETYYRLLAPCLLPEDIERILWLDADLIVRKDIRAFYYMPLNDCAVAACTYGPAMRETMYDNALDLKLKEPDKYFNAGVLLMDMGQCRKLITREIIDSLIEDHPDLRFHDQDILNIIFEGKVMIVDYRLYNNMVHSIVGAEDLEYAKKEAAIIHFPGPAKPWSFNDIHFADEWGNWYHRCFGNDRPLRRMSYFQLKALYEKRKG